MAHLHTSLALLLFFCSVWLSDKGYCELVANDKYHYGSRTGAMCKDKCKQEYLEHYLCTTAQGLEYCSPSENTDYKNNPCREDSPCGKHGQNYNWCFLKNGGRGYCGLVEPKMFLHRSVNNNFCVDECQYHESGDYYWCHTEDSWDYCSPHVDVTYKDEPCRSDHFCGLHGYSYNWCWTSDSYDYCGRHTLGECIYITSLVRKTKYNSVIPKDVKLICTLKDRAEPKIITFTAKPTPDIADGSQWKREAEILISRWENKYLVDKARLNLIDSNNLRIDTEGTMVSSDRQLYYDLRIRVKHGYTTVSKILVPPGIRESYIRRAFLESFRDQAQIAVILQDSKHPIYAPLF